MFSKQNHVSIAKISTFSEKTKKLVKTLLISKYYTNFADGKETFKLQNDKER
jgi:hypothetical protein